MLRFIGPTRDAKAAGTVADVVHIRLNEHARAPHAGVSPILAAADTAGALAGLERALKLEAAATTGYVIPSSSSEGLNDEAFTALKKTTWRSWPAGRALSRAWGRARGIPNRDRVTAIGRRSA